MCVSVDMCPRKTCANVHNHLVGKGPFSSTSTQVGVGGSYCDRPLCQQTFESSNSGVASLPVCVVRSKYTSVHTCVARLSPVTVPGPLSDAHFISDHKSYPVPHLLQLCRIRCCRCFKLGFGGTEFRSHGSQVLCCEE